MAKKDPAAEGLKRLRNIEGELEDIKENTGSSWQWFVRGALQGAGFLIGTILAVVLGGWLLSLIGVIPGFGDMADSLRELIQNTRRF